MPKFDASSIGGKLEYDFSDWNGPKGVVPEPSRVAVNRMMKQVTAAFKEVGLADEDRPEDEVMSPDEVSDKMNKIDDEAVFEKLTELLTEAIAELCAGSPTREELVALPYRPFIGFFGYLVGNLTNPEASAPGTKTSANRLRSV